MPSSVSPRFLDVSNDIINWRRRSERAYYYWQNRQNGNDANLFEKNILKNNEVLTRKKYTFQYPETPIFSDIAELWKRWELVLNTRLYIIQFTF